MWTRYYTSNPATFERDFVIWVRPWGDEGDAGGKGSERAQVGAVPHLVFYVSWSAVHAAELLNPWYNQACPVSLLADGDGRLLLSSCYHSEASGGLVPDNPPPVWPAEAQARVRGVLLKGGFPVGKSWKLNCGFQGHTTG